MPWLVGSEIDFIKFIETFYMQPERYDSDNFYRDPCAS